MIEILEMKGTPALSVVSPWTRESPEHGLLGFLISQGQPLNSPEAMRPKPRPRGHRGRSVNDGYAEGRMVEGLGNRVVLQREL